jgi:hypothetical protein
MARSQRSTRNLWISAIAGIAVAVLIFAAWRMQAGAKEDATQPQGAGSAAPHTGASEAPASPVSPRESARRAPERELVGSPGAAGAELVVEVDFQCGYEELPSVALALRGPGGAPQERPGERTGERAVWSGLPPGSYQLTASADGWQAEALDLELGTSDLELQIPLQPRYWLAGVVLDGATRAPVTDFEVRVHERRPSTGQTDFLSSARSMHPPDGRFCIAAPQGWGEEWRLVVSGPRHDPVATDWRSCRSQDDGLVLLLESKGSSLAGVKGRTVDEAGAPVAGARLGLAAVEAGPASVWIAGGELWFWSEAALAGAGGGGPGAEDGRAHSGEDGSFEIHTRYAGSAKLVAYAAGHAVTWSEPFELLPGLELDVGSLLLGGGASLRGEVIPSRDPRDRIQLRSVTVSPLEGTVISVDLDEQLAFAVDGLGPGMHRVSVDADMPLSFGAEGLWETVTLASELVHLEPFESKHVVLSGGAEVTGARLHGTLAVADARLTKVGVLLFEAGGEPLRQAILREDQSFAVPDVPAGHFTLVAIGLGRLESVMGIAHAGIEVVPAAPPAPIDLVLGGARIELRAPDAPEARISIVADTGLALLDGLLAGSPIRTDAEGRAELIGLPPGSYQFGLGDAFRSALVSPASPDQVIAW